MFRVGGKTTHKHVNQDRRQAADQLAQVRIPKQRVFRSELDLGSNPTAAFFQICLKGNALEVFGEGEEKMRATSADASELSFLEE